MRRPLAAVFLFLLASLVLVPAPAFARDVPTASPRSTLAEVEARLAAEAPGIAAWGAYLAGRDGHRDATAALRGLLRRHRVPFHPDWNLAHRAALDALIRLDEEVDDGLLGLHERRFPVQVLVLRARRPERHVDALRDVFTRCLAAERLGLYGIAVGNLLVGERASGVAAPMLGRIRMTLTLRVRTRAPEGFGGRGGSRTIGVGCGDAFAKVPEGFPPYVHYALWRSGGPGRELLARGPRSVWSRRTEREAGGLIPCGASSNVDTETCSLEWSAALLDRSVEEFGIVHRRTRAHDWDAPEAYVAFAREAQEAMLAPWWRVAGLLRQAGLVSREELLSLEPSLRVTVEDRRTNTVDALPALPVPARPVFAREP